MFKRINNWHLSALVIIVSIFSLVLIEQYASAQWQDPTELPGNMPSNSLVVNPLAEDLQLGGHKLIGTNFEIDDTTGVCLSGVCKVAWPGLGSDVITRLDPTDGNYPMALFTDAYKIGKSRIWENFEGAGGQSIVTIEASTVIDNMDVPQDAFLVKNSGTYDIETFVVDKNGKVGIGKYPPRNALDITTRDIPGYSFLQNTQINIESSPSNYWGIYQKRGDGAGSAGELKFWTNDPITGAGDKLVLTQGGDVTAAFGNICDINGCIGDSIAGASIWYNDPTDTYISRQKGNAYFVNAADWLPAVAQGAGIKFFWYPNKAAFRAGSTSGTQWDENNIGFGSVAFGGNNTALGTYSAAFGLDNTTTKPYSAAIGYLNNSTGHQSTAIGYSNEARGSASLAAGFDNDAAGERSIALGESNLASGGSSVTIGNSNTASGINAKSFGYGNSATGDYSIAIGNNTTASGYESITLGTGVTASGKHAIGIGWLANASAYRSVAVGSTNLVEGNPSSWVKTDPIFVVGNGNGAGSNAVTVLKNGNVGIGTSTPSHLLAIVSPDVTINPYNAEINIQSVDSPPWGIYQNRFDDDLIFWNGDNNVIFSSNGDVEVAGNLGVTSVKDTNYNYIQLDTTDTYPPADDCNESSETGRMYWVEDGFHKIFVCSDEGWRYIQLGDVV